MVLLKLRTTHGKNSSNKNTKKTRYTNLRKFGGLYRQKLNIETKSQEETETEMSSGVLSPQGGAAWSGPTPLVVRSLRTPSPARFHLMIFHI
jgi:hypothetical protein